jgi:cytochrome P450
MAELLHHPDKMKKVNAELAEQLGSKDFVTEGDLSKLPYLHAVVKETLRLHPAVPLIPREVVTDDVSRWIPCAQRNGRRRQPVGDRKGQERMALS